MSQEAQHEKPLSTSDIAGRPQQPATEEPRRDEGAGVMLADEDEAAKASNLFNRDEAEGFKTRWNAVQTGFVDEPRNAVEQADTLVAEVMKRLAEIFAQERSTLEHQWDRGDQISTEDLRVALRRYRAFFGRLLAV